MVDIDTSVKAYFEDQRLDEAQLQRLINCQRLPKNRSRYSRWLPLSAAASLLLAAVLFWSGMFHPSLTDSIAKEIAMNHNKQMAVEFSGERFLDLGRQMAQLDFQLRRPSQAPLSGLRLLGSRYCSIQGQIAAQVKLSDDKGRIYTLYQTRLSDELLTLNSDALESEGVEIKLWREGDTLYGFAQ